MSGPAGAVPMAMRGTARDDRACPDDRPDPSTPSPCVGTSGWSYGPWAGQFYRGVPRARWLAHYAAQFDAVELNASFYRFVATATYAKWRDQTPARFRFAIKGHRAATHERRLRDVADVVARQRDAAAALGDRLAVVLWQLPRSARKDPGALAPFLDALGAWAGARHAVEFRDYSWFDDDTAQRLAAHRVAAVISDAPRWPMWDAVTTDLVYVRLHGRPTLYASSYDAVALAAWAARVAAWRSEGRAVHLYFDNTMAGAAPADARRFLDLLAAARARGAAP